MDSILTSVKKALGIEKEYKHFDVDIIMHINSVFSILTQLGVGPSEGFRIEDEKSEWKTFIKDQNELNMVKSYMYLKVRLLFDSQSLSSSAMESAKQMITEFEWRLNAAADPAYKSN